MALLPATTSKLETCFRKETVSATTPQCSTRPHQFKVSRHGSDTTGLISPSKSLHFTFYMLNRTFTVMQIWNTALAQKSGSARRFRTDVCWAEMSFLARTGLFHTSPRHAPFTWTFSEADQFNMTTQGRSISIVTRVMTHCSLWSSAVQTTSRLPFSKLHMKRQRDSSGFFKVGYYISSGRVRMAANSNK